MKIKINKIMNENVGMELGYCSNEGKSEMNFKLQEVKKGDISAVITSQREKTNCAICGENTAAIKI